MEGTTFLNNVPPDDINPKFTKEEWETLTQINDEIRTKGIQS